MLTAISESTRVDKFLKILLKFFYAIWTCKLCNPDKIDCTHDYLHTQQIAVIWSTPKLAKENYAYVLNCSLTFTVYMNEM